MTMSDGDGASTHSGDGNRRGPIAAEEYQPGPEYMLPPCVGAKNHDRTKKEAPSYSIGIPYKREKSTVPGPNAYGYNDRMTAKGPQHAPMYSLQSRPGYKEIEPSPGPGAYNTHTSKYGAKSTEPTPRAAGVVGKDRYQWKSWGPPATRYTIKAPFGTGAPDLAGGKSWSIGANHEYGGIHYESKVKGTPCASRYGATDPSILKKKSPSYSQGGRTQVPAYNTSLKNPGPGAYDPKMRKSGGFSFGVRRSAYMVNPITQHDLF